MIIFSTFISIFCCLSLCRIYYLKGRKDANLTNVRLARYRLKIDLYDRWLAEFPVIVLVLQNLKADAEGEGLDTSFPPSSSGPWAVEGLRNVLRKINAAHTMSAKSNKGAV